MTEWTATELPPHCFELPVWHDWDGGWCTSTQIQAWSEAAAAPLQNLPSPTHTPALPASASKIPEIELL